MMTIVYSTVLWDKQNETCTKMSRADTVCVELVPHNGNSIQYSFVGQAE